MEEPNDLEMAPQILTFLRRAPSAGRAPEGAAGSALTRAIEPIPCRAGVDRPGSQGFVEFPMAFFETGLGVVGLALGEEMGTQEAFNAGDYPDVGALGGE